MEIKPKDILQDALKIAEIAYKAAQNEFGYDSGFYGMQQAEIEGSKCLILSIILAEQGKQIQPPSRIQFLGDSSIAPSGELKTRPEENTDVAID